VGHDPSRVRGAPVVADFDVVRKHHYCSSPLAVSALVSGNFENQAHSVMPNKSCGPSPTCTVGYLTFQFLID
jgi:hypothetical protein